VTGSFANGLLGIILRRARGQGYLSHNINRRTKDMRNLLTSSNSNKVSEPGYSNQAYKPFHSQQSGIFDKDADKRYLDCLPMTPNASNEDSGFGASGTSSLEAVDIAASPYFTLTGWKGFWPLDESG
jgi:hypothetical protein